MVGGVLATCPSLSDATCPSLFPFLLCLVVHHDREMRERVLLLEDAWILEDVHMRPGSLVLAQAAGVHHQIA